MFDVHPLAPDFDELVESDSGERPRVRAERTRSFSEL